MRGSLILAASVLALASQSAKAQNFTSGDIQLLHSPKDGTVISTEVAWNRGHCGGYGFLDVIPGGGQLTYVGSTNVDCKVVGSVFVSAEVGGSNFGRTIKAGVGVHVRVPGMKFVDVTVYPFAHSNEGDRRQVKVVYQSEDIKLGKKTAVYFSGFARIRDGAPLIAQPQVWVKRQGLPFEVGSEVAVFGRHVGVYGAIKLNF